jgi:hypothetical protein
MPKPRIGELCTEVCECVTEVVELLDDYRLANEHHGRGTHRDPVGLLDELHVAIAVLRGVARDARDAARSD